jgi:hypothetical protein
MQEPKWKLAVKLQDRSLRRRRAKRRLSLLLSITLRGALTAVPEPTAAQQTNPLCTYQTDPDTGVLVLDANGNPIPT